MKASRKKASMLPANQAYVMFSHPAVADHATAGRGPCVQVSKRTRIWAGGLSTAGGKFPN
jgi:hypothetical protein